MKKEEYKVPRAELFQLSTTLSFLGQSFSLDGGVEDWDGGTLLDNEFDDSPEGSDFQGGGLLGNN